MYRVICHTETIRKGKGTCLLLDFCKYKMFRPNTQEFLDFFHKKVIYLAESLRMMSLLSKVKRWLLRIFSWISSSVLLYMFRKCSVKNPCTLSSTAGTPSLDGEMHKSPLGTISTSTLSPVSIGSPSKCTTPGWERCMMAF